MYIMRTKLLFTAAALVMMASCNSDEPSIKGDNPAGPDGPQVVNPNWVLTDNINLSTAEKNTVSALGGFNDKLMAELAAESEDGSFCASPLSISLYLGMLANSCQGDAQAQIVDALGCGNLDEYNALSTKLLKYLPSEATGSRMQIANHIWVADRYTVPKTFVSKMADVFNAGVDYVNFAKTSTFESINKWASTNTNGIIDELIPETQWKSLSGSQMFSANAVYFQGKWIEEFNKSLTSSDIFYSPQGNVSVPTMHKESTMHYAKNEKAEMVIMQFSGSINQLEIYLPAKDVAVKDIASVINSSERKNLSAKLSLCDVTLALPSYTTDNEVNMNEVLNRIGIKSINAVNLSPMGIPESFPMLVNHKVVMQVNEKGAEMAAVTGGLVTAPGNEGTPAKVTMTVNRPFMYIVRNNLTNTILVAGVVTRP